MLPYRRISFILALLVILFLAMSLRTFPAQASLSQGPLGITLTPPAETRVPPTGAPPETRVPPTPTDVVFPPPFPPTKVPPTDGPQPPEEQDADPTPQAQVLPVTGELPLDPPSSGGLNGIGPLAALFAALVGSMLVGFTLGDRLRKLVASLGTWWTGLFVAVLAYGLILLSLKTPVAAASPSLAAVEAGRAIVAASAPAAELSGPAASEAGGLEQDAPSSYPQAHQAPDQSALERPLDAMALDEPSYLVIPKLDLDTRVVKMARNEQSWDTNGLNGDVGWLEGTSLPGPQGNTVLAGHITARQVGNGPFRFLHRLQPGDKIMLYSEQSAYVYRVREQRIVYADNISVTENTGEAQLTLITCTDWDYKTSSYLHRRMIVAELVKVSPLSDSSLE